MALMSMNSEFGVMNLFYGGGTGLDATTRPAQTECFVSHIKTHKFFGALQMKNIYKLSGLFSDVGITKGMKKNFGQKQYSHPSTLYPNRHINMLF